VGDRGRSTAGVRNLFGAEVVRIGVPSPLSGDDPDADPKRYALCSAFYDRLIDTDRACGEVFEVDISIVAAGVKSLGKVTFQVALCNSKL
jgi:hypothetical protein